MTNDMKKYDNLHFHRGVDFIFKQHFVPQCLNRHAEGGYFHPKHLDTLYIVGAPALGGLDDVDPMLERKKMNLLLEICRWP
jgi:hypothetical protein